MSGSFPLAFASLKNALFSLFRVRAGDKLALICRALPLIAVWKERDRGVGVVGVITQHAKVHPTLFTLPK